MRLSTKSALDKKVWKTLEKIRICLGARHEEFADLLSLTRKNYLTLKTKEKSPTIYQLEGLMETIHVSLERIIQGDVDYSAVAAHARKEWNFLPTKYSQNAFSKKRTSIDVLMYIEQRFGWNFKYSVLRHFQINEIALQNPNEDISLQFLTDLCRHLGTRGVTENQLAEIGRYVVLLNQRGTMGKELSQCQKPKDMFDLQINHLMNLYDSNYSYSTPVLKENYCEIKVQENPDVRDLLRVRRMGDPKTCATRMGRASAIPAFAGLPFAGVYETHCIHRGDSHCRLRMDYEFANYRRKHPLH